MNKFLALTCMAVALAVGMSVQTNAAAPAPSQSANSWPPPPKAIVNWCALQEYGGFSPSVSPGSDLLLMTVPAGRWFIMTETDNLYFASDGQSSLVAKGASSERILARLQAPEVVRSTVGLAFPPECQVVLRNDGGGSSPLNYYARFTGYFTRE
jgi:hypothetical protein